MRAPDTDREPPVEGRIEGPVGPAEETEAPPKSAPAPASAPAASWHVRNAGPRTVHPPMPARPGTGRKTRLPAGPLSEVARLVEEPGGLAVEAAKASPSGMVTAGFASPAGVVAPRTIGPAIAAVLDGDVLDSRELLALLEGTLVTPEEHALEPGADVVLLVTAGIGGGTAGADPAGVIAETAAKLGVIIASSAEEAAQAVLYTARKHERRRRHGADEGSGTPTPPSMDEWNKAFGERFERHLERLERLHEKSPAGETEQRSLPRRLGRAVVKGMAFIVVLALLFAGPAGLEDAYRALSGEGRDSSIAPREEGGLPGLIGEVLGGEGAYGVSTPFDTGVVVHEPTEENGAYSLDVESADGEVSWHGQSQETESGSSISLNQGGTAAHFQTTDLSGDGRFSSTTGVLGRAEEGKPIILGTVQQVLLDGEEHTSGTYKAVAEDGTDVIVEGRYEDIRTVGSDVVVRSYAEHAPGSDEEREFAVSFEAPEGVLAPWLIGWEPPG